MSFWRSCRLITQRKDITSRPPTICFLWWEYNYVTHSGMGQTSLHKVIWEEDRVAALSHAYAVKSPLVTMTRSKLAPKIPLLVDRSPNRTTCLIIGFVRLMVPNGIRIRSAVFHNVLDRPADAHTHGRTYVGTDRSSTEKFDDYNTPTDGRRFTVQISRGPKIKVRSRDLSV